MASLTGQIFSHPLFFSFLQLQREQAQAYAAREKTIKIQQAKELKQLQADNASATKEALARVKTLPKGDRKAQTKTTKEELEQTLERERATLIEQQAEAYRAELAQLQHEQRAVLLRTRLELMQKEHDLLMRRTEELSRLGEQHILEKQQMLKHQLKSTFSMQKHQMYYRHEKEALQLHEFHVKKLADLDKKYDADLKFQPKRYKSERNSRKKELKKQINGMPKQQKSLRLQVRRGEGGAKMKKGIRYSLLTASTFFLLKQNFDNDEQRRFKSERSHLEDAYKDAREALQRAAEQEKEELLLQQHAKKQMLISELAGSGCGGMSER